MRIAHLTRACIAATVAAMAAASATAAPVVVSATDANANGSVPTVGSAAVAAHDRFLSNYGLTNVSTESFEALATLPSTPLAIFGKLGTLTQVGTLGSIKASPEAGRFNTTPGFRAGHYWQTASTFTISLESAASAFGYYATDLGDFAGGLTFDLYLGGTQVGSRFGFSGDAGQPDGTLTFYGFVENEKFDQIVVNVKQVDGRRTDEYDYVGFDDLIVGTAAAAVPEPTTLTLSGLGLGLLSLARRRSRK